MLLYEATRDNMELSAAPHNGLHDSARSGAHSLSRSLGAFQRCMVRSPIGTRQVENHVIIARLAVIVTSDVPRSENEATTEKLPNTLTSLYRSIR